MFIKALSARFVPVLALLSGMALVLSAYASEGHGAPAPHEEELKDPPPLRPSLRPDLKASASKKAEHDKATSEHEGGREGAREGSRGGATASKPEPAVATDGKTSVSMAELRDMIDQKIAEVRTKREVPPVVRLRPKAKPVKRHGQIVGVVGDLECGVVTQNPSIAAKSGHDNPIALRQPFGQRCQQIPASR